MVNVALENAGRAPWRQIEISYHWLDDLGNPMVWGEIWAPIQRTVEPGERFEQRLEVRGPLRVARQRLAIDLVDDGRLWFSEVGNVPLEVDVDVLPRIERALGVALTEGPTELVTVTRRALDAQEEALVDGEDAAAVAYLAPGCLPGSDWSRRLLDAHQEGYAVVAGSIEPDGRRARRALAQWAPGAGRVPTFPGPLLCPSVVQGIEPEWVEEVEGVPAAARPREEPWLFDGRIRVRLESGRRRG
jgi:hypothetical protein